MLAPPDTYLSSLHYKSKCIHILYIIYIWVYILTFFLRSFSSSSPYDKRVKTQLIADVSGIPRQRNRDVNAVKSTSLRPKRTVSFWINSNTS